MLTISQRISRRTEDSQILPKLEVGAKDDPQEKEADRMADKVMRMSDGPGVMQDEKEKVQPMREDENSPVRKIHDEEEGKVMKMHAGEEEQNKIMKSDDEEEKVRPQSEGSGGMVAPAAVSSGIAATKGKGASLAPSVQQEMGEKMGADFSQVNIHTGDHAEEMNRAIGAKAFTHGTDIYFNRGQYDPQASSGKHLLAHELTHTMQQSKAVQPKVQRQSLNAGKAFEPWQGKVLTWSAALRKLPNKNADNRTLADIPRDSVVTIVDSSGKWLQTIYDGKVGYVSQELIKPIEKDTTGKFGEDLSSEVNPDNTADGNTVKNAPPGSFFVSGQGDKVIVLSTNDVGGTSKGNTCNVDINVLRNTFISKGIPKGSKVFIIPPGNEVHNIYEDNYTAQAGLTPSALTNIFRQLNDLVAGGKYKNVLPKPWDPKGKPVPPYIGSEAHDEIALHYQGFHLGDRSFYNYFPNSTILAYMKGIQKKKVDMSTLTPDERLSRPDILNTTKEHLYEIKPWTGQATAKSEAVYYQNIYRKAGINMKLGPIKEPGVTGIVPAPAGFFVFYSPEDGVILYKWMKGTPQKVPDYNPVPVPVPVTDYEPAPSQKPVPYLPPVPVSGYGHGYGDHDFGPTYADRYRNAGTALAWSLVVLLLAAVVIVLLSPVGI